MLTKWAVVTCVLVTSLRFQAGAKAELSEMSTSKTPTLGVDFEQVRAARAFLQKDFYGDVPLRNLLKEISAFVPREVIEGLERKSRSRARARVPKIVMGQTAPIKIRAYDKEKLILEMELVQNPRSQFLRVGSEFVTIEDMKDTKSSVGTLVGALERAVQPLQFKKNAMMLFPLFLIPEAEAGWTALAVVIGMAAVAFGIYYGIYKGMSSGAKSLSNANVNLNGNANLNVDLSSGGEPIDIETVSENIGSGLEGLRGDLPGIISDINSRIQDPPEIDTPSLPPSPIPSSVR